MRRFVVVNAGIVRLVLPGAAWRGLFRRRPLDWKTPWGLLGTEADARLLADFKSLTIRGAFDVGGW